MVQFTVTEMLQKAFYDSQWWFQSETDKNFMNSG